MTDEHGAIEPDPFVRTALQLLPVPPHRDAFWTELRAALDAEPAPGESGSAPTPLTVVADAGSPEVPTGVTAAASAGAGVVELVPERPLGLVPPGLRRRSNVVLSAVAVAAAVVVVIAGTALVRERGGGVTELADGTGDPGSTVVTAEDGSTSVAALQGAAEGLPADAVLAWVGSLGRGDIDAAWAALGSASQAHFGSQSAFESEQTALAEGYGAWSAATPDEVYVTPLRSSGDGELVVVTLVGTVQQEGSAQHRADAFPVRIVDGAAHIELYAFAGELEIVVPEPQPAEGERPLVHADDALVVVVPRGVEAPTIRLDDGEALVCGEAEGTELTELEDAPGQRCSYHPDGGIPAGDRVLTVAFVSPDGTGVAAESVLFEAA
jgi:hypothetical protein